MNIVDRYIVGSITNDALLYQIGANPALIETVSLAPTKWNLLHAIVRKHDVNLLHNIIEILSAHDMLADVIDKFTYGGTTPITLAVQLKHTDMFVKLKDSGADILAKGDGGHSAVFTACCYPGTDEIKAEIITILGDAGTMQAIVASEMDM